MSAVDRARFAHWTDVHEMNHIGVDSDALWRELEVLEAVDDLVVAVDEDDSAPQ